MNSWTILFTFFKSERLKLLKILKILFNKYSVFSKLNYITNNICSVKNLYNLNSLYTDKTAIRLLMSIQYKNVYEDKLIETYKNFLIFKFGIHLIIIWHL